MSSSDLSYQQALADADHDARALRKPSRHTRRRQAERKRRRVRELVRLEKIGAISVTEKKELALARRASRISYDRFIRPNCAEKRMMRSMAKLERRQDIDSQAFRNSHPRFAMMRAHIYKLRSFLRRTQ